MRDVRNWRWEKFSHEVAGGGDPREASTIAGYKPDRANHNASGHSSAWRVADSSPTSAAIALIQFITGKPEPP
jgi:hypothetical protein